MEKMKELHHEIRIGVKQLERGALPNPRRAVYVQNDANLEMANQSLRDWLGTVHEPALRNVPANVPLEQQESTNLRNPSLRHRVQHLIG